MKIVPLKKLYICRKCNIGGLSSLGDKPVTNRTFVQVCRNRIASFKQYSDNLFQQYCSTETPGLRDDF